MRKVLLQTYSWAFQHLRPIISSNPLVDRLATRPLKWLYRMLPARTLIGSQTPNPYPHQGHQIYYRTKDEGDLYVILNLVRSGIYERETTQALSTLVKPGMNVVDLGAHLGYYTLLLARTVGPCGHVWAFEPAQDSFYLLRKNVEANGYTDRITLENKAVSSTSQRTRLFISEGRSDSTSLYTSIPSQNSVEIETTNLDEYFEPLGWPPVGLIKMDVEGAEKFVLDGMSRLSTQNPGLKLILEINLNRIHEAHLRVDDLAQALLKCGFQRFSALYHGETDHSLRLPQDLPYLTDLARRANINLLCQMES